MQGSSEEGRREDGTGDGSLGNRHREARPQRPLAGLSGYGSQANGGQREREAAGRDCGEHADAEGE